MEVAIPPPNKLRGFLATFSVNVCGIDVTEILEFSSTPGFGKWKRYFPKDAAKHPAKMNLNLLNHLVQRYTDEGDLILDPMSGSGSTGVLSVHNNRNAICVEFEDKFCAWIREARELTRQSESLVPRGKMIVLQGDARNLSDLLADHAEEITSTISSQPYSGVGGAEKYGWWREGTATKTSYTEHDEPCKIDVVISSPPYSETLNEKKNNASNLRREERLRTSGHLPEDFMDGIARNCQLEDGMRYSYDERNIGNLKQGNLNAIVTSHPYDEGNPLSPKYANAKGKETYLDAMKNVYGECYKVLKPEGKLIIVVKRFIRNFKAIKLEEHTKILCEAVGFKYVETLAFKLPTQSFWRLLYAKKHAAKVDPVEMMSLNYEWVLVFEKPASEVNHKSTTPQQVEGLANG